MNISGQATLPDIKQVNKPSISTSRHLIQTFLLFVKHHLTFPNRPFSIELKEKNLHILTPAPHPTQPPACKVGLCRMCCTRFESMISCYLCSVNDTQKDCLPPADICGWNARQPADENVQPSLNLTWPSKTSPCFVNGCDFPVAKRTTSIQSIGLQNDTETGIFLLPLRVVSVTPAQCLWIIFLSAGPISVKFPPLPNIYLMLTSMRTHKLSYHFSLQKGSDTSEARISCSLIYLAWIVLYQNYRWVGLQH